MTALKTFIDSRKNLDLPAEDAQKLIQCIADASVEIAGMVNRAGLIGILGAAGSENIQGEDQQKLDVLADEILIKTLKKSGLVAAAASEEHEEIISFGEDHSGGYVVAFDPLDGSSNIDVNISIGTIFSIYKRLDPKKSVSADDFLRTGIEQLIAGYVIYGPSTMMMLTVGTGAHGFTLNPDSGEYLLSHPNIEMPVKGKLYSINEGNFNSFPEGIKDYMEYCKSKVNDQSSPYSSRYIGSMVADLHRNLLKGGIFLYPATAKVPAGKLRLLYECLPMAYLVEEAGGMASTGTERILSLKVEKLHQRIPIAIGSEQMVEKFLEFAQKKQPA